MKLDGACERMNTMKKISKAFLHGYIRALDLTATKEWPNISGEKTKDYEALRSDWDNVGRAIRKETRDFKRARG